MITRRSIGSFLLIAHALAACAFPGGPVLCDEGGGRVKIEPLHAPHALSCRPGIEDSSVPELSCEEHEHDFCTDTAVFAPCGPAQTYRMRDPAPAAMPAALRINAVAAPAAGAVPDSPAHSPPMSPHISTTVIRS